MRPDIQRELIPRANTLHLIGALKAMKAEFSTGAQKWQLLDESGHVPAEPSFTELFQHVTGAQDLSHKVLQLTADFAGSPHSRNQAGRAVLTHLAMASTMSGHATAHFAETAETALSLQRSPSQTDRRYPANRMLIDHSTARAYLRRTSESLHDAVKELDLHLDCHRFFPTPSPRASAAPASKRNGRRP
ncbi:MULTISPECIES: hypothetical protein [unclassified Streptomyces]|uniref:hypothetical protein n=1 Tax=unclassified Streptomyces TaxID=2593676 RepID=UPI002E19C170|nr:MULTISPECIES: hypothetical protein [unclassified Streptomyces]